MNARTYGQVIGVVLLLLGAAGLALGDQLFGLVNIELVEDLVHLGVGAVLVYIGFGLKDARVAGMVASLVGVTLLVVGVAGFVVPNLLGLLPKVGYTAADNIVHLALGALGILAGRRAGERAPVRT